MALKRFEGFILIQTQLALHMMENVSIPVLNLSVREIFVTALVGNQTDWRKTAVQKIKERTMQVHCFFHLQKMGNRPMPEDHRQTDMKFYFLHNDQTLASFQR